jgi:tRNA G26 N,N-dimethylase Trm1
LEKEKIDDVISQLKNEGYVVYETMIGVEGVRTLSDVSDVKRKKFFEIESANLNLLDY